MNAPPLVLDDQFVQNFFTWALARNPTSSETTFWYDQLRVAHGQGQTSVKLAAIELGRTLFESAEYAARNRTDHWYVYDLYKTYLMRDPDDTGWHTGRQRRRTLHMDASTYGVALKNQLSLPRCWPASRRMVQLPLTRHRWFRRASIRATSLDVAC